MKNLPPESDPLAGLAGCSCCPPRRRVLGGLVSLAAGALLPASPNAAEAPAAAPRAKPGWIDVHHHFAPPAYSKALEGGKQLPRMFVGWSPAKEIEDMDQAGISTAFNSIVTPGPFLGDAEDARRIARDANEYAARMAQEYRGRFGSFACLPLPDMDASLAEAAYALDTLKADGIALWTSYGNRWLGDPFFDPLFQELDRRKAVVFTHPTTPACCGALMPGISPPAIEFGTDTTRAIARMVYSGAAKKYPGMRMIFSHAGGTMPYLIGRFVDRAATASEGVPDFLPQIRRFYYDTAQATQPIPLAGLKKLVPLSQILFGTDYPYRTSPETVESLTEAKIFSAAELQKIRQDNPRRLLPRAFA
jgi:predicted TIM-barrel fold metal-dependent hydrolase